MERVVVSVDGSEAGKAAVAWCARHLTVGTAVIAVCGISELGEFAVSMPPFELAEERIEDCFKTTWCKPLRDAGLLCEARLVHLRQAAALAEVARVEQPDALVIGQRPTGIFGGGKLARLLRRPPCPVVVVPVETRTPGRRKWVEHGVLLASPALGSCSDRTTDEGSQ